MDLIQSFKEHIQAVHKKETSASLRENNSLGRDRKSQRKGHPSGARVDIAVFFQAHRAC